MNAFTIVEHLDVIEDRKARLVSILEGAMPREFILQIAEEALSDSIV